MKMCIRIRRDEQGRFVASVPSLPGCVICADSEEQAREKLEVAIRGYLASVSDFVPHEIHQVLEYQS